MSANLKELVADFLGLVEGGQPLTAIERYYAPDVIVFENRELARAGREQCLEFEREASAQHTQPPKVKALRVVVDADQGLVFIEWKIRFLSNEGRPMLLEEVCVQEWERGQITNERFYYEGYVDEGDPDAQPS